MKQDLTGDQGFDDIVMLDPRSAHVVGEAARLIARRGILNLVGVEALDGMPVIDVGRIHYDYTAYLGNPGPDIAASYGEAHNRCELRPSGVMLVAGAGGPMGQMHTQRAIEMESGPHLIIATDVNDARLALLKERFQPMAEKRGKRLIVFNPQRVAESLRDLVMRETSGRGADDVIACVPSGGLIGEVAALMASDGMLVLFAGVAIGTLVPLNLSQIYLQNAQFTGTSGLRARRSGTRHPKDHGPRIIAEPRGGSSGRHRIGARGHPRGERKSLPGEGRDLSSTERASADRSV